MLRCLGIVLLTVILTPAAAGAHTNSVETNPEHGATLEQLPATATISFSEEPKQVDVVLAKPGGAIDVLKPRIDGPVVTVDLPADAPRGEYGLSYRVVSADGHPVSGSASFSVTSGPKPAPTPTAVTPAVETPAASPDEAPSMASFAIAGGVTLVVLLAGVLFWLKRR